jgi:hypothetical protein
MRHCGAVIGALLLASRVAVAQQVQVKGVVRDSVTGEPLAGALVDLRNDTFQMGARSNQRGEFRIYDVPRGDYRVTVRRIGFLATQRILRTADRDTSLTLALHAIVRELDTMRVIARGMSIYGVIGTTQGVRPLRDAKVQVMGLNRSVNTDSAGRFSIAMQKAGTYLVRVAHPGYTHQLLSVEVSADRSMETSTLLDTLLRRERATESMWNDFERRIVWRGPRSAIVPASELEQFEGTTLSDALNRSPSAFRRGLRIGTRTCVFIDGRPRPGWPVDAFRIENVDAVELYGIGADGTQSLWLAWPTRVPCSAPQGGPLGEPVIPTGTAVYAVIWLKP